MERIWFVGAPGLRWSGVSQFFEALPNVDLGDRRPYRQYTHGTFSGHRGSYFDPGMEGGEEWLNFPLLPCDTIIDEIDRIWGFEQKPDTVRLIKSHILSLYVDEIKQKFPHDKVVMVLRNNEECLDWWLEAGGYDITWPKYSFYSPLPKMQFWINMQNNAMRLYADQHNLKWEKFDSEWLNINGVDNATPDMEKYKDVWVLAV